MNRKSAGAVLSGLFLAASLTILPSLPLSAAETLKLGVAGSHSGDLASYGLPTVKAVELVVKELNAKGGILGKRVEPVVVDDACKPELASNATSKLISQDIKIVIGHTCSGTTKAVVGIYRDAKVILISPSATSPELTQSGLYPNFYRTIASDDAQARLGTVFVLEKLKLKKIALLHDKGDYGKGFTEYVKRFIGESQKASIVLFEGITPGAVDYSAVIQKVRRSEAEAVMYGGFHPEAASIVSQMRKKNFKALFISDDGVKDDTFIKVAGTYAEGIYATGPKDVSRNPLAITATEAHRKTYGTDPGSFFLNAYTAAQAILNAVQKAGSTDYTVLGKTLQTQPVDTPLGRIRFDAKGDAIGVGFSMYQVRKGSYVEVK